MDDSRVRHCHRLNDEEREALLKLLAMVHGTGVDYFVCSGTMLGLARNGHIIPWDEDVDVAVKLESYAELLDKVKKAGAYVIDMRGMAQVRFLGTPQACMDIFAVAQLPDGRWAMAAPVIDGVPSFAAHTIFPKECYLDGAIFPTKVYSFADGRMEVRGPQHIEALCLQAFGDNCLNVALPPHKSLFPHGSFSATFAVGAVLELTTLSIRATIFIEQKLPDLASIMPTKALFHAIHALTTSCLGQPSSDDERRESLRTFYAIIKESAASTFEVKDKVLAVSCELGRNLVGRDS